MLTQEGGSDLVTLLDETEKLRKDVKTKDALLLHNEERLEEINLKRMELEQQYSETVQELETQKDVLKNEKMKAQKALNVNEAELRKLRAEHADKKVIEHKEIEIMHLKKKLQQHQAHEKELVAKIVDLKEKLESTEKLEWTASNLEKQLKDIRPEFESERTQMLKNIYKMLKYVIPEELLVGCTLCVMTLCVMK